MGTVHNIYKTTPRLVAELISRPDDPEYSAQNILIFVKQVKRFVFCETGEVCKYTK